MTVHKNSNFSSNGFTVIEVLLILGILLFFWTLMAPAYLEYRKRAHWDLCSFDETEFVNYIGGLAAGTAISSAIAGKSMVLIVTESGFLYGTAPVIAPSVTLLAGTGMAAYGSLKVYCNREGVSDTILTWFQASIDSTSEGMEVPLEKHGKLVNYTSRTLEEYIEWLLNSK